MQELRSDPKAGGSLLGWGIELVPALSTEEDARQERRPGNPMPTCSLFSGSSALPSQHTVGRELPLCGQLSLGSAGPAPLTQFQPTLQ